ncbi:rab GTPase-binding effector protein 2 [Anolis carolinensis]|uniref:rab GTPase-binding effector protein 2 n=1 Tax=Anolis carolinensis TaxID=28377 RepID=UPI0004626869|nr:PREDICTED: rab GTPase-binding effector protein 2 [Anolis carolinensis]|eukprot:XP_008115711.1 PREDICTED: rab GTPase-binding effector protein 2 [Anolis carolinensis]
MEDPEKVLDVGAQLPSNADPEDTIQSLQAQLAAALTEVETVRTVATVSEGTKQEAVEAVRRQWQEEVASLQAILKDTISSYEARLSALERSSRENAWSRLLPRSNPLDSLEKQMEKAQEDTQRLRAIVLPMEQEIAELKAKLARAEGLVQELQSEQRSLGSSSESLLADADVVPSDSTPDDHITLGEGGVADKFARGLDSVSIASIPSLAPSPGPPIRRRFAPSPETVSIASSTGTLVPETIYLPPAGYQLVPAAEWTQLHEKVQQQHEALEAAAQEKASLEEALRRSNDECSKQVQVLLTQVQTSERLLQGLQTLVSETQRQTQEQMADLAASHKRMSYEVQRLSAENEGLRSASSQDPCPAMDDDNGSFPSTVEELQALVNKLRQGSASQLRAAEHQAERLRIEIVSLRERLDEEATSQSGLQEALEREQEERELLQASLNSIQSEMERLQQSQEEMNRTQAQIDAPCLGEASSVQERSEP